MVTQATQVRRYRHLIGDEWVDASSGETVLLNNPPFNLVTLVLSERLLEVTEDPKRDEVRVVVLIGAGGTFCTGADIKEVASVRDRCVEKTLARENEVFGGIEPLSKPTIEAIQDEAIGGGCEIALACDLRVMADRPGRSRRRPRRGSRGTRVSAQ